MYLQNKLEEVKKLGSYSVSFTYGEDTGCDDMDVPQMDRRVIVIFVPVGCIGEAKMMYQGTLKSFLNFDLKTKPVQISNPPKREEYKDGGYFIWGTNGGVKSILKKPFHGKWN